MPDGALETVPVPLPDFVTVSAKAGKLSVAVTDVAALIVTLQVPVPAQPPPFQPVKSEPAAGVAVSVTVVPFVNPKAHVVPHVMPAGALATVPDPEPLLLTVSVKDCSANVAVTLWAALIVTVQAVAVPVQPPLQPVNVEPAAGAAVRVTAVPDVSEVEHVVPQLMPTGELVTVPLPVPALLTVSVKEDGSANVAVTLCAALIVTVRAEEGRVGEQRRPGEVERA